MAARALIGLAVAVGAAGHALGVLLHQFGIDIYAHYPGVATPDPRARWCRRCVDRVSSPSLGIRRGCRVLLEQVTNNGIAAVQRWRAGGEVQWFVVVMHGLVLLAPIAAWPRRSPR